MGNWRIFPNTGASIINSAPAAGDAAIIVQSGSSFPNPATGQEYKIKVDSEFMLVTAVSGTTLTVIRGADGSTAASHALGALVVTCITQDDLRRCATQCNPPSTTGTPSAPFFTTPYQMAFDPATNKLYIWNGSAWKSATFS